MKRFFILLLTAFLASCSCTPVNPDEPDNPDPVNPDPVIGPAEFGNAVNQQSINRVKSMPRIPDTYKMLDWRQKALDYDAYVFDWNAVDDARPLIWLDESRPAQIGFGLKTTVGDVRQGKAHQSSHEAINTMAAVLSGGLMGIDKTSQDGYNYVQMLQKYFASGIQWNIMVNGTSGYAKDWWYNVLPNVLYWGVCDVFPGVEGQEEIQRSIADQFARADEAMGENYSWSWFNYYAMKGETGGVPRQEDAAAGHAYVLLNAYRHFGDENYLVRAKNAVAAIDRLTESRFYEILLPFGAYVAAVLNATEGTEYDVRKIIDWTFEGNKSNGRRGWGVICEKWGDYDVYGLQGSITDGGGYAFQMNSYEMAWPLVPMVKYAPEFAAMVGKWMLNNASASRLFFPYEIADANQACADIKDITGNVIGYEGLRKTDRYGKINAIPVAEGDGPSWTSENPDCTMFSLYSTSPIGIFGSIISTTDVEGIISLDCNATDFYADRTFPCHLIYNPYLEEKTVTYTCGGKCDLFDTVSDNYLLKGVSGGVEITIGPAQAVLVYELPAGTELFSVDGNTGTKDGHIIAWARK